jgi:hypothetical protein
MLEEFEEIYNPETVQIQYLRRKLENWNGIVTVWKI